MARELWCGGADDGPLVIVFHGCPDTRHLAMTGDEAARQVGVRLACVNRPGYGTVAPLPFTPGSVADGAVVTARVLGHDRFAVLGMSVGGQYATATAARHPDVVTALGLVSSQGERIGPGADRDEYEAWVAGIRPDDEDDAALAARWYEVLPAADAALLGERGDAAVAASVREALAQPDGYLRDAELSFSPWPHRPEAVTCPVRLWAGELDEQAAGPDFGARFPDGRLDVRPGVTHLATLLAHWHDVLATLRGYLD